MINENEMTIASQQATIELLSREIVRLNHRIDHEYKRYQELWKKHAVERDMRQKLERRSSALEPHAAATATGVEDIIPGAIGGDVYVGSVGISGSGGGQPLSGPGQSLGGGGSR